MPSALTPLANITLSNNVTGVTFSSFSTGFRDYMLVCQVKGTSPANLNIQLNGDTGGNYFSMQIYGDGSSVGSGATTNTTSITSGYGFDTTNELNRIYHFLDASATDKHKIVLHRSNRASSGLAALVNRWANNSAISSIYVYAQSNLLASGSTFALYGVSA